MPAVQFGAAQEYIEGVYGGPTEETDTSQDVITTPTKIVGNDPDRLALTFINVGSAPVYLLFEDTVSTNNGIVLDSGGGYLSMNVRDDQTLPTRKWYGITSSGSVKVLAIATRRYTTTYAETLKQVQARLDALEQQAKQGG